MFDGDAREVACTALAELVAGDESAAESLFTVVYQELRSIAAKFLQRERDGHTLQPTALVHEAWMRLAARPDSSWNDAAHFKAVTVRAMRRVLVDHARRRRRAKRGGGERRITLSDSLVEHGSDVVDLLALDAALDQLAALHERQARVVELRFLGGLTVRETAHVLGVDPSTVKADWMIARVFLAERLTESPGE